MVEGKPKFKVAVNKMWQGSWSFGVCLTHSPTISSCGFGETYLYINLIKISISIGWLVD